MKRSPGKTLRSRTKVMVLGVGAFAQSTLQILREAGADVIGYLTRDYAHDPPRRVARCYFWREHPDLPGLVKKHAVNLIVPMSIDWAEQPWADELIRSGTPIFCPVNEALKLERERDLARRLCEAFRIPFPKSHWARSESEARRILRRDPRPYVIKNPLCGPFSPIHTIVCERAADTEAWLPRLDYRDGVFLQEFLGRAEAGHIAVVSGGEIHSLVTNQEYKRAFAGNQGVVAGAPLGGLVEQDPNDKYGLAKELLAPLLPWFRKVNFHGPVQVTAIRSQGRWFVLEYNVRIGVTSGAMILRMLRQPVDLLSRVARDEKIGAVEFKPGMRHGCSITLAGYGYPYTQISGPEFPVRVKRPLDCDVWWNEIRTSGSRVFATGHRIADVVAMANQMSSAIRRAYENIRRIECLASYYREDIGASLWPPGKA